MRTRLRQGFTLIELLVTISIVALLASLVISGVGNAQAAGRNARAKSDITELDKGLRVYRSDNTKIYLAVGDNIGSDFSQNPPVVGGDYLHGTTDVNKFRELFSGIAPYYPTKITSTPSDRYYYIYQTTSPVGGSCPMSGPCHTRFSANDGYVLATNLVPLGGATSEAALYVSNGEVTEVASAAQGGASLPAAGAVPGQDDVATASPPVTPAPIPTPIPTVPAVTPTPVPTPTAVPTPAPTSTPGSPLPAAPTLLALVSQPYFTLDQRSPNPADPSTTRLYTALYNTPGNLAKIGTVTPRAALTLNNDWYNNLATQPTWYIEEQRYDADLIQAGIVCGLPGYANCNGNAAATYSCIAGPACPLVPSMASYQFLNGMEIMKWGIDQIVTATNSSQSHQDQTGLTGVYKGEFCGSSNANKVYACSENTFHSGSFFVEAAARALLLEKQAGLSRFDSDWQAYGPKLIMATDFLATPPSNLVSKRDLTFVLTDANGVRSPVSHRYYLWAAMLSEMWQLTGNSSYLTQADQYADTAMALQTPQGINPEKGGYDVSYQMVGLRFAEQYYTSFSDSRHPAAVTRQQNVYAMLGRALNWEDQKMERQTNAATKSFVGKLDTAGSTRIDGCNSENARSGSLKSPDYKASIWAMAGGTAILGDAKFLADAKQLYPYYRDKSRIDPDPTNCP